jgi:nucleoside-diphosphate-sugar epimerase
MLAIVTGAAGFVASHLTDRLLRDGWAVTGVDNLATGDERNLRDAHATGRFRFINADVSQPWEGWLGHALPRLVLHFASPASPVHFERLALETMAVNATGTMHAVACAQRTGATLLYASTSETYGDPLEHPQRETYWGHVNPVGIRSCYDESKRFGEAYVTTAARKLGIDGRVARIFNTYGPRMSAGDGRVVANFCVAALRGEPLTVFGSGAQTRSFCYVDDLVDGLARFATRPALGGCVINVGSPDEHTIQQLAEAIARAAGVELRVEGGALPSDDPARRRPDIALARELLDWQPVTPLEAGLQRTLDYFRSASLSA